MTVSRFLKALSLLAVLGAGSSPLYGQRILGPGDDATTLPRRVLRISLGGDHTLMNQRWNQGEKEPLGTPFSLPALGADQLPSLGPLQTAVRDLGVADFSASLGGTSLDLRQRVYVTPFSVEFGLTEWLTFGVTAPLVRVRAEGQFQTLGSGLANLGRNPYFTGVNVPLANRQIIDQFTSAANVLQTLRSACATDISSSPDCPTIVAEDAAVGSLITMTNSFAGRLGQVYGGEGLTTPSPYVPLASSGAAAALTDRVDSLRNAFNRYGVAEIAAGTGLPLGGQTPPTIADIEALIADSANGFGARSLASSARINIGDIDINAKIRLYDAFGGENSHYDASGFGIRQSLGLTFRIGSGIQSDPRDFLDLGTGTGENAIGVRSYTDLIFSQRYWTSVVVGWAKAQGGDVGLRVPRYSGQQLIEADRFAIVPVTRGSVLQAEVSPRILISDYFAVSAYWGWRKKQEDTYDFTSATSLPGGAPVSPESEWDEQRAGLGVTFSTLAAQRRGGTRPGFEITWTHRQSITSSTGTLPVGREDRITIRYYTRIFAR